MSGTWALGASVSLCRRVQTVKKVYAFFRFGGSGFRVSFGSEAPTRNPLGPVSTSVKIMGSGLGKSTRRQFLPIQARSYSSPMMEAPKLLASGDLTLNPKP